MNIIQLLKEKYNLSIWIDQIDKEILDNLPQLVKENKIFGITTNPTIFNNAINRPDYKLDYNYEKDKNIDLFELIEQSMIKDVKKACQIMLPIFEKTNYQDGLVSIEVPPYIAYDTFKTIQKALELWEKINMPNVMIKIPATDQGIEALKNLYSQNININVTLLFSVKKYNQVIEVYKNSATNSISVASFFVSRVDTIVDDLLNKLRESSLISENYYRKLIGKVAIANSLNAYKLYKRAFEGYPKIQRILWASTSTKNPSYHPLKYVQELLTPNSINTLPLNTYKILLNTDIKLEEWEKVTQQNLKETEEIIKTLEEIQNYINFDYICEELLYKGVSLFSDSYNSIVYSVINKLASSLPLA